MKESRNIIVCRDGKSPYCMAQWTGPDDRKRRKSTKVPVAGGAFRGENLSRAQARRRALLVAFELARQDEVAYAAEDNRSVRELFALMLNGKLGRVSLATYGNARTDYKQFCGWLGKRADEPARKITKADILECVAQRRQEVRCATTRKALSAIRAAFSWAVNAELFSKNPCDGVRVPPDTSEGMLVKHYRRAMTREEAEGLLNITPRSLGLLEVRCTI